MFFNPQSRYMHAGLSEKAAYYSCGICGSYHPATWDGDCRDDAARFDSDALDARHGWNEANCGAGK